MTFKEFLKKCANRYVFATLAFLLIILFFDQFNIREQIKLHRELKQQEEEIEQLEKDIALYKDSLYMVTEDRDAMEKIAREKYFMKRDNETVYRVNDK